MVRFLSANYIGLEDVWLNKQSSSQSRWNKIYAWRNKSIKDLSPSPASIMTTTMVW